MYTCLTSGVAFFPNMLAVPKLEEVDFGVRCIWLNDEEPVWGILYHSILGVVSRFSVNVIDETRVKVKSIQGFEPLGG